MDPLTDPLSWRLDAACRTADPDLFFVEGPGAWYAAQAAIRDYCQGCPVRRECRDEAERTSSWGVWGGEQRSLFGKVQRAPASPPPRKGVRQARGACRVCGRPISLFRSGAVRAHRLPATNAWCDGSGSPAAVAA